MHVLLIHQAFVSPEEAGGTRHYELACHLVQEGHQVTIVASNLSYLTGQQTISRPALVTEELLDGIRVLRAYTYPALHRSFVWRVFSFLSFMVTSIWAALRAGPVDLVMGTSPPIFQAVSAWVVSKIIREPFLLEIRDLWPEFAIGMGVLKHPLLIRLSRWLEGFLYAHSYHLLVNSPAYRDYLIKNDVRSEKISLIPNGVNPNMFDPKAKGDSLRKKWDLDGKFVLTYTGALGLANDISSILKAANRLRKEPQIHFLIVGDGKERENLEALAKQLDLPNVTFAEAQPKSEIPEILAASDACIAILQDIPMFKTTYPNKVFDYMAAGRPTILAIDGVIREVVEAANGGVFVWPGDDAAIAEAVFALSKHPQKVRAMGEAARGYVIKHFNRRQQAKDFAKLIEDLTKRHEKQAIYCDHLKRILDLILTIPGIIIISPVILLLALLVRFKLGSPVLYCQERPGLQGKPFSLFKFRTMNDQRDANGDLLPDADRLTNFGKLLRQASLDELPELINVLKGEMSLVGPRPLLMQYLDRYTPEQARRHEVKPGITGWAQVNGRNAITWEQKFEYDVWYVEHQSFWLDIKIIALTIWKILKREGISQSGHATAEEFRGHEL